MSKWEGPWPISCVSQIVLAKFFQKIMAKNGEVWRIFHRIRPNFSIKFFAILRHFCHNRPLVPPPGFNHLSIFQPCFGFNHYLVSIPSLRFKSHFGVTIISSSIPHFCFVPHYLVFTITPGLIFFRRGAGPRRAYKRIATKKLCLALVTSRGGSRRGESRRERPDVSWREDG